MESEASFTLVIMSRKIKTKVIEKVLKKVINCEKQGVIAKFVLQRLKNNRTFFFRKVDLRLCLSNFCFLLMKVLRNIMVNCEMTARSSCDEE